MKEEQELEVDERVILSKYDGEVAEPGSEVERLVIHNGIVIEHNIISDRKVVGPVMDGNLAGKEVGRLIST